MKTTGVTGGPCRWLIPRVSLGGALRSGWDQVAKRREGQMLQSFICRPVLQFGVVLANQWLRRLANRSQGRCDTCVSWLWVG